MATKIQAHIICKRCLGARTARPIIFPPRRSYSDRPQANSPARGSDKPSPSASETISAAKNDKGAMTRRLEEATEEALLTGGRAGRRAIEDAGFSEELKARLLDKVQAAKFQDQVSAAKVSASSGSGGAFGTSTPWTGTESQSDAVLRMLDDAKKPLKPELRGKYQIPNPVDMRPRAVSRASPGQRAANAREQAGAYAGMGIKQKDKGLTEEEREAMKREFRERFAPAARDVPATLTGLASLANERIEDAIARGAFRDIPRGKDAAPRDTRADNPFIDTTEYLLNKMIQRQDIVPPWIEKQQDLSKAARIFRARLRNDWRRHAARLIASKGGTLEDQVARAEGYALAEKRINPGRGVADAGETPPTKPETPVTNPYASAPFRDPEWEEAERAYMTLAIENLNTLTRSYNLMAPELAKKPYLSLERELKACFADVAPLVAGTIRERATGRARSFMSGDGEGTAKGTVFDRFGNQSSAARVYDNKAPHYGLKEMWRDMWKRGGSG